MGINELTRMMKYWIILFLYCSVHLGAREKRDLLINKYSRQYVFDFSDRGTDWIQYPGYHDRHAWETLPSVVKMKTVQEGEKYIGYKWPAILPSMYLDFTRTGNRGVVDNAIARRLSILQTLCFAELVEGKGRFMDDIINGLFAYCEQTYWGASAHFYLYEYGGSISNPKTVLPDNTNPIIDLFVGDVAANLAWIWYLFHHEFDKISPIISKRIRQELKDKVLIPFYQRNDFWWITGWNKGDVNNWTPWCNYNMLTCILLLEDDPQKRLDGIYKTMRSVDLFINAYPNDGGCDEGPSYWGAAVGKLFDYLDLLKKNTQGKIDIFSEDIIKNMGEYICRFYISKGLYYINFSDAPAQIKHEPMKIFRGGKNIQSSMMEKFASFLKEKYDYNNHPLSGHIGDVLANRFDYKDQNVEPKEPLISDYYFPDLDVAIARDCEGKVDGFYFAAKGGHNGEGHNHNDVGSFILFYNGEPVLVDVGVGTYTRETFSSDRYKIWTMQSGYHNLPIINGCMQMAGKQYKAQNSKFSVSKDRVVFSTDIAKAYSEHAKVKKWQRTYTLQRNKSFNIQENFYLEENCNNIQLVFMTPLVCKESESGMLDLIGKDFGLQMIYNPSEFSLNIETLEMKDPKMKRLWGDSLYRVILNVTKKSGNQKLTVRIKPSSLRKDKISWQKDEKVDVLNNLSYCLKQAEKAFKEFTPGNEFPRRISVGQKSWSLSKKSDWTSGFWPGILWYLYDYTKDVVWKDRANIYCQNLFSLSLSPAKDHDLGFQLFCSLGNGYRLTKDTTYRQVLLRAADTLSTLYNPKVGTILSWPFRRKNMNWPHNTIIDNMMNLELLFWASKNGGDKKLYDIAFKHAETTMYNHFRNDNSSYHVIVYDTITGKKIKGVTYQGYANNSMWARGQAWAIYGFTMVYRETGDKRFLEFAKKITDCYLKRLPIDMIPYWDFDDPTIPFALKDASSAAIVSSALIELSMFVSSYKESVFYLSCAEKMLNSLSKDVYQSRDVNNAFLLHSVEGKSKIISDCSIVYADYYYLEALLRLNRLERNDCYLLSI